MPAKFICILVLCFFVSCSSNAQQTAGTSNNTFVNPLLATGPDPWVIQHDGYYYCTHSFGNRIAIYKTSKMSELGKVSPVTVWTPPATGAYAKEIWAPELHFINNKWYVYFAADDGSNDNHRLYVIENSSADPLTGTWVFKGKIAPATDKWAIDASVFEYKKSTYLLWSGWPGDTNGVQNIYIAKMKDPLTIDGDRVMISTPNYNWEKHGAPPAVNEGPEVIKNSSGIVFLTFSASGCWTDNYGLGLLTLKKDGDPMNASDWVKSPSPVFETVTGNNAFAPGHNGFFISKDGKENWIIYHANTIAGQGCGEKRNTRMQKFTWNADGTPNFGKPLKLDEPLLKPAGE